MNKYKDIVSNLIVTCFFVGRVKYAPGTFGSLLAFPINFLLAMAVIKSRLLIPIEGMSEFAREFVTVFSVLILASIILFIVGVIASNSYMARTGRHDPSEIVIDEVVGQMIASALTLVSVAFVYNSKYGQILDKNILDIICYFLLPFALFRVCDIIKPWPIGWMDKNIKGGVGVMLDDVAAALMAAILHYAIVFLFI